MVVMNKHPANKTFGVILVDNIPPQTTDSQLTDLCIEMNGVSSIEFVEGEGAGNLQRSCWIVVSKPEETVRKLNVSTIAGEKPRARLMGYLFKA